MIQKPLSRVGVLLGVLTLAGCATIGGSGESLAGQTLRMESARGDATTLQFRGNGTVLARFSGRSLEGRWQVQDRRLCFLWAGAPRECWPWSNSLRRGESRAITSDRGNRIRVTRL